MSNYEDIIQTVSLFFSKKQAGSNLIVQDYGLFSVVSLQRPSVPKLQNFSAPELPGAAEDPTAAKVLETVFANRAHKFFDYHRNLSNLAETHQE